MSCEIEKITEPFSGESLLKLDLPEGVPPLSSLYMYISGSCNLACRHCWISPTYQPGGNGGQHIKVEYVGKAIRKARPLGLRSVKLTGGEPVLHPEFRQIVRLINNEELNIQIETNGTLIDRHMAKFLKQMKYVSFISVSVDGADKETHEDLRGLAGSYDRAIKGIKNLVEQGFRPQLICTLHKGNLAQAAEVIELAEILGCGSVKFNHIQQIGRGEQFAGKEGLDVKELIKLYEWIEKEMIQKTRIRIRFDIPLAFYPIRRLVNDPLSRCTIMNILGVLSDGALSMCGIGSTVPELIYGHIEKASLRDVWCHSPGLVQLREQVPKELEGICGQCLHRDICLAACVANNFHAAGRLTAPYQFCDRAEALGLFPLSRKK